MKFNRKDEEHKEKVNPIYKNADDFHSKHEDLVYYVPAEGRFYTYRHGVYKPMADDQGETQIKRYFREKAEGQFEFLAHYPIRTLGEFINNYKTIAARTNDEFNQHDALNFENGMYFIKDDRFVDHDPKYLSTIRIPYEYNKEAECPNWLKFLSSSLEDNEHRIELLQEYMGYCLGRDIKHHKALFLIGEPGAGKGTILKIIENMVGHDNCSSVSLDEFGNSNNRSNMLNKLVNIDGDVSVDSKRFEAFFRCITSGDPVTGKILYKNTFSFKPYCKLVIAANELPRINDRTRGFYRRMIVIPFNVTFEGREDKELNRKLDEELPGILNWALQGRRRLIARKLFNTEESDNLVNQIKLENNPIEQYFKENIVYETGIVTLKSKVFDDYVKWCHEGNNRPLGRIKFNKEFFKLVKGKSIIDFRLTNVEGSPRAWVNYRVKTNIDDIREERSVQWEQ